MSYNLGVYCIACGGLAFSCLACGIEQMSNREELQAIKAGIMAAMGWKAGLAVGFIASQLNRSPASVYEWLSKGRQDIPDNMLELLKLKLKGVKDE